MHTGHEEPPGARRHRATRCSPRKQGQSEKADAATSVAESIRVMTWASSIISSAAETQSSRRVRLTRVTSTTPAFALHRFARVNGDLQTKGLDKNNMSQYSDAMSHQSDHHFGQCEELQRTDLGVGHHEREHDR